MSRAKLGQWASRLTGVSTPLGGVAWTPPPSDREAALRLFVFLEDRRVLYNPYYAEIPRDCIGSIFEVRRYLTAEAQELTDGSVLRKHLRAMAAGTRELLDRIGATEEEQDNWHLRGMGGSMDFQDALGRLRAGFGQHIAFISERFEIAVPKDLQSILPPEVTDDD